MFWNQQNLYPRIPTVVAKLLQYSGSRVELRDGFSSYKMILQYVKMVNFTLDLGCCKNSGGECLETENTTK